MLTEKAKNSAFWEKVRTKESYKRFVDELLGIWEKDCSGDIPACKYTEYVLFDQTGSRTEYEKSYFTRRRALNASALLSLIYPNEEKYYTKLCDVIWAILDEYNWTLPAHIGNFKDNVVDRIDLFAAETGFALSEIDYIFEDRLPALIRSRISAEVDRRIIKSYMSERREWWEKCTNNWAAVCVGSVGITFMYQRPDLFFSVYPRIKETLACFLRGFPEDGICLEGFGYWHYGFGFYLCFADMLREFSKNEIDCLSEEKIKEIVKYPQRMYIDGGTTVSFSDGSMSGRWHIGILHYLKKRFPGEIRLPDHKYSYTNDNCGRWGLHLRAILWFDEELEQDTSKDEYFDYAPASQWLIKKSSHYAFAAKGGDNGEPHNHNDLGSFIVAKNGEQILCDPGAGKYSKQYFNKERYTFFKTCSRGHSVPIIDGRYQKDGRDFSAESSFDGEVFTVRFERAYGIPSLTELTRRFSFDNDTVTVSDTFEFDGKALPVTERFISRFPAEITDEGVYTGGLVLIAEGEVSISQIEGFWCIDYVIPSEKKQFTLKIISQ